MQKAIAVEQQVEAANAAGEAGQDGEVGASTAALAPAPAKQNPLNALLSTLQKAVRRADEREAMLAAIQLDAKPGETKIDKKFSGQLWKVLRDTCAEDTALSNLGLAREIRDYRANWLWATRTNSEHQPWRLWTIPAVLVLCRRPKSRIVDHACLVTDGRLQQLLDELTKEPQPPPIPAYAHDGLHTAVGVGKSKAEALADFLVREDAVLTPRAEDIDDPYREQIFEALREAQPGTGTGAA